MDDSWTVHYSYLFIPSLTANKTYNHLIALRYSPDCCESAYGLTLNSGDKSEVYISFWYLLNLYAIHPWVVVYECINLIYRFWLEEEQMARQLVTVELNLEMKYVCMRWHLWAMLKRLQVQMTVLYYARNLMKLKVLGKVLFLWFGDPVGQEFSQLATSTTCVASSR